MITLIHLDPPHLSHSLEQSEQFHSGPACHVKSFTLAGRPGNTVMQRTQQWASAFQQDGQRVTGGFIALERGLVKHQVVVRMGEAE